MLSEEGLLNASFILLTVRTSWSHNPAEPVCGLPKCTTVCVYIHKYTVTHETSAGEREKQSESSLLLQSSQYQRQRDSLSLSLSLSLALISKHAWHYVSMQKSWLICTLSIHTKPTVAAYRETLWAVYVPCCAMSTGKPYKTHTHTHTHTHTEQCCDPLLSLWLSHSVFSFLN